MYMYGLSVIWLSFVMGLTLNVLSFTIKLLKFLITADSLPRGPGVLCWSFKLICIYSNKHHGVYLIFCVFRAVLIQGRRLLGGGTNFKGSESYNKDKTTSWVFFMAYRLEANISFGFHNILENTFLQVLSNVSLDVKVLTVAESLQDLTKDALYLSLCI